MSQRRKLELSELTPQDSTSASKRRKTQRVQFFDDEQIDDGDDFQISSESATTTVDTKPSQAVFGSSVLDSEALVGTVRHREVYDWMKSQAKLRKDQTGDSPLLIVKGPSGCGKTMLVRNVARDLGLEPVEYSFSYVSTSSLEELRKIASQSSYPSLFEGERTGRQLLILDDLPSLLPEEFRSEILRVVGMYLISVVLIFTDSERRVPDDLSSAAKTVSLHQITRPRITKALRITCGKPSGHLTVDKLDQIAADSAGDLRAALNAIQSFSISSDGETPVRDEHLTCSHAAAKVFYMKRLADGSLKDPPQKLSDRLGSDSFVLQAYLFSNLHSFFTDPADTASFLDDLSEVDIQHRWCEDRDVRSCMRECSLLCACWSVICNNKHAAKPSFKPLTIERFRQAENSGRPQCSFGINPANYDLRSRARSFGSHRFALLSAIARSVPEPDSESEEIGDFDGD
mmetsp:Transcript_8128/g.24484  ORF Transcript_8128/g.24484 Transcript_8128/m.24484 type:complete len:458 (+) Transcript_8128:277-1650(+)